MKQTLLIIGLLISMVVSGCVQTQEDKKFCQVDSDCATSCGEPIGRGDCFNKKYVSFEDPPDGTCCACEDCRPCVSCKCVDNVCTSQPYKEKGCC